MTTNHTPTPCKATANSGKPCSRRATANDGLCTMHRRWIPRRMECTALWTDAARPREPDGYALDIETRHAELLKYDAEMEKYVAALTARVAELEAALREVAGLEQDAHHDGDHATHLRAAAKAARAALAKEQA